jgi:hypothetical protein
MSRLTSQVVVPIMEPIKIIERMYSKLLKLFKM